MIALDDVRAAAARIAGRVHRTPTFSSRSLGPRVHLKAELFQVTGSFKVRGVLNKLAALTAEERARGVIGISAGNHAQALAWGALEEGLDALLVMWRDVSVAKVAATRAYGAAVDLDAADPTAAFTRLEEVMRETGRVLVHPFDDPVVIAGAGTVGLEIVEDVADVGTVLVATGGGGLVSGVATAVKALRPDARVVAVEPELSTALHDALAAGRPVPVQPRSIADGLSAPFAGAHATEICTRLGVESVLVSEDEISDAFRFLYTRAKLACEPAAAAAVAPLLSGRIEADRAVVVVSGGNVAPETASAILAAR